MGFHEGIHFAIIPMRLYDPSKIQEILSLMPKDGFGLQLMDADLVAGYEHLILAISMAIRAWKEDRRIARSLAMEVLLYASAKRQIKEAIESIGSSTSGRCVILILSDSKERLESILPRLKGYGAEDDSLIELTEEKIPKIMRAFGIGEPELSIAKTLHFSDASAVQSLILERISISDLNR
ncbi:MAG: KEOPS complex subunit Cgi121 [Candidatus Methanomethyliaceae archaeon]|nr:KEOPS complex subunit Cgi121 [Candidatus Methanomethyliaceae archaeon]